MLRCMPMSDLNQYLYRIQAVRPAMLTDAPTADEARLVGEHFAYLKRLRDEGVVLLAGRTQTADLASFGIIIFRAPDDAAAQRVVDNDPAVVNRVMRAELFPYRIAVLGDFSGI